MNERLLSRAEAAAFLNSIGDIGTSTRGLAKRAVLGNGPRYQKFGRRCLYREADLVAWFNEYLSEPRTSTSDTGGCTMSARQNAAEIREGAAT